MSAANDTNTKTFSDRIATTDSSLIASSNVALYIGSETAGAKTETAGANNKTVAARVSSAQEHNKTVASTFKTADKHNKTVEAHSKAADKHNKTVAFTFKTADKHNKTVETLLKLQTNTIKRSLHCHWMKTTGIEPSKHFYTSQMNIIN